MMDDVKTVGKGLVAIAIMALVLTSVFGVVTGMVGLGVVIEEIEPVEGESTVLETQPEGDEEIHIGVDATQARAVALDGEGYVRNTTPDNWGDASWTFAVTATPNVDSGGYGDGVTHVIYDPDDPDILVAWNSGEWLAIVNDGGESARVSVPATADRTEIVVTQGSGELGIHADGENETAVLDSEPVGEPSSQFRWVGALDEVRFIDGVLTDTQIEAYQADPVDPLKAAAHDGRVMFNDDGSGTVRVYYTNDSAELVNARLTDGVAGPELELGVDFEASRDPLSVTITQDSYLAGAPTAFVTVAGGAAAFAMLLTSVVATGTAAFSLLVVGLLVLAALAIMRQMDAGFSR